MIPVDRWSITYADGSTFTSDDGTWSEAPPFAVFAVVYYHVDGRRTVQMEQHDRSIYRYLPDVDGAVEMHGQCAGGSDVKFGLWVSNGDYVKLFDRVHGEVTP